MLKLIFVIAQSRRNDTILLNKNGHLFANNSSNFIAFVTDLISSMFM
jgi:hypothetical protein